MLCRLLAVLVVGLYASLSFGAEVVHPTPKVDVEIVWTEIFQNKTGFYVLISNPQDFDIYVGNCKTSETTIQSDSVAVDVFGDGCTITGPENFMLVGARSKRLLTLLPECRLHPGENRCSVHVSSWVDPKIPLPWNYVVIGERNFAFSIANVDTLRSR
jgi:hypothetical protein